MRIRQSKMLIFGHLTGVITGSILLLGFSGFFLHLLLLVPCRFLVLCIVFIFLFLLLIVFSFSVFFVHCSLSSSSLSSSSHDFIFLLLLLVLLLPPNPLPLLLPLFLPLLCRIFIVIPVLIWTWFFFGDVSCRLLILDPYYRWVVVVLIVVVVVVVALDVIVLLAVAGYQLLSSPHLSKAINVALPCPLSGHCIPPNNCLSWCSFSTSYQRPMKHLCQVLMNLQIESLLMKDHKNSSKHVCVCVLISLHISVSVYRCV